MSGLKDRLARLKPSMSLASTASPRDSEEEQHGPDSSLEETADPSSPGGEGRQVEPLAPEWQKLGAEYVTNEWGQFIRRRREYALEHAHGYYSFDELTETASVLSAFEEGGAPVFCDRLLFLDTETTGLGIGAGNVPFMIGIGFYRHRSFVVEQLFIRNPAEELAMLAYLLELLNRYTHIVSYNGRTFDWPIIKNRFVLNRMKLPAEEPRQLDFLYPSRSVWRNTLVSCRLSHVEEERLGIKRVNDVSGSFAPAIYFQYLATDDAGPLHGVFEHNERDIMTLACLAVHFSRVLLGRIDLTQMEPEELYRTGAWLDKMGCKQEAEAAISHLLKRETNLSPYYGLIASRYKKAGDVEQAVALWKRSVQQSHERQAHIGGQLDAWIELAMYYEHKQKDAATALYYAEEALQQAKRRMSALRRDAKQQSVVEELNKRVERLRSKLARQEQAAEPSASKVRPRRTESVYESDLFAEHWKDEIG